MSAPTPKDELLLAATTLRAHVQTVKSAQAALSQLVEKLLPQFAATFTTYAELLEEEATWAGDRPDNYPETARLLQFARTVNTAAAE